MLMSVLFVATDVATDVDVDVTAGYATTAHVSTPAAQALPLPLPLLRRGCRLRPFATLTTFAHAPA